MARFHFHVHNSVVACDPEGLEMSDLAAAMVFAKNSVRQLMSDEIRFTGRSSLDYSIRIATPEGAPLHTVRYGDGVEILP
jgi:hypothetical protein